MTPIAEETQRNEAMRVFKEMAPAIGTGPVLDYIRQTVVNVMGGADVIKDVPGQYTFQVEYAANRIAQSLRNVARVHLAGLGTRIFYVIHGGTRRYDTHANELPTHATLLTDLGNHRVPSPVKSVISRPSRETGLFPSRPGITLWRTRRPCGSDSSPIWSLRRPSWGRRR